MKTHAKEFPIKKMSEVFKVSRSGYYQWLKREPLSLNKYEELDKQIKKEFAVSRCTYGSPRVCKALTKESIKTSQSTVARRMKVLGIAARRKKKFKHTTNSKHDKRVSANVLKQQFMVSDLAKVWVSDITYIAVKHRFVYLTTVIDLADRMVIGWSLSKNMTDQDTCFSVEATKVTIVTI